ncbi:galactose metabolism- protein [Saxophila tyrrhenica]|uniref:Galactose metabolism- protein n=1 Tax=Saxophila tyrrhenica TaxID=1690608 RepID=A0AAV9P4C0_9PEZI|nr:galactose metabolism- protein [Saxophila tyrrhenica]
MGNSQSQSSDRDAPKSPAVHRDSSRKERTRDRDGSQYRTTSNTSTSTARRAQSHVSASASASTSKAPATTPPNPTATLLPSTTATSSTSTSNAHAHAETGATSSHSRARSITSPSPHATSTQDSAASQQSGNMGNAESRQRPPSRSSTLPPPQTERPQPSPSSQPVDVPANLHHHDGPQDQDAYENTTDQPMYGGLPASDFSRPPRLPLPIDRDPEPTSPIATPTDATTPHEISLTRRPASMLSSTTLDDEEVADIETFTQETDPYSQKVLTTLEWRGKADTVFVTGTFINWEKKFKMQKDREANGNAVFSLTAPLPTGTHHIKFLVDGEMVLSNQYPTTVDYTNSLVNYVEIAAQLSSNEAQPPAPAEPMPIPGAAAEAASARTSAKDFSTVAQPPETNETASTTLQDTAPAPAPSQPPQPTPSAVQQPQQQQILEHQHQQPSKPLPKTKEPRPKYTSEIPEFLQHVDLYSTPDDERFRRASKATAHLPQPPTLPMFMSKSILNAATPHKDDASVLTMPNHTVLNHLATSSIRQGVLATSGTTRYKRKFLTTIMYKPTGESG